MPLFGLTSTLLLLEAAGYHFSYDIEARITESKKQKSVHESSNPMKADLNKFRELIHVMAVTPVWRLLENKGKIMSEETSLTESLGMIVESPVPDESGQNEAFFGMCPPEGK